MQEIICLHGESVAVDAESHELLSRRRWYVYDFHGKKYASTHIGGKRVYMHRLIVGAAPGQYVDHADGDGLNNRRENLRICGQSHNLANQGIAKHNTSGYKGVTFYKRDGNWAAQIKVNQVRKHLGRYPTPEEAARAYDAAARAAWGEFARTNF